MRNLIITADDCGLSEGINLATAGLYQKGMLTTASVMTNFEASRHALELFARSPGLDVGVHLNLTDGVPVSKSRDLRDLIDGTGRFRGRAALVSNALAARRGFLKSAGLELAAQIDFFTASGIKPRHLTTHLHFHAFPSLQRIVYELARDYNIEWVRNKVLSRAVVPYNIFLQQAEKAPEPNPSCAVASPDYVLALKYWMHHEDPKRLLAKLLSLQGAIELVIHPCLERDPTYPQGVAYPPHKRFREMQYFEQLLRLVSAEDSASFRLVTMRAIR